MSVREGGGVRGPDGAAGKVREPKPVRVAKKLLARLQSGAFPAGRLPSQRDIAHEFGVARSTAAEALRILQAGGLVQLSGRRAARVLASEEPLSKKLGRFLSTSSFEPPLMHAAFSRIDDPARLEADAVDLSVLCNEHWDGHLNAEIEEAALARALGKYRAGETSIYGATGIERLKELVAQRLAPQGIRAGAAEIAIVPRRLQAYRQVSDVLAGCGCELWASELSLMRFYGIGDRFGARRAFFPLDARGGVDFSPLWFSKRPGLVFLEPDHPKPCGASLSVPEREALVRRARGRDLFVFEDCYCSPLYEDRRPPLAAFDPEREAVIHLGALPTWLSPLGGFSFILAHERIIRLLRASVRRDYLNPEFLAQLCAIELAESGDLDRMLERFRGFHRKRILEVDRVLARELGSVARWSLPGSFGCIWLELPGIDIRRLYRARRDIDFQPGWFYGEPAKACRHVMLRYTMPLGRFEEGVRRLRTLLQAVERGRD